MVRSSYETYQIGSRYENSEDAKYCGMCCFDQVTKRARDNHYKHQLGEKARKDLKFVETCENETRSRLDHLRESIYYDFCHENFPKGLKRAPFGKYFKADNSLELGEKIHAYFDMMITEGEIRYKNNHNIELTDEEQEYITMKYAEVDYTDLYPDIVITSATIRSRLLSDEIYDRVKRGYDRGDIKVYLRDSGMMYEPKMQHDIESSDYQKQAEVYRKIFLGLE